MEWMNVSRKTYIRLNVYENSKILKLKSIPSTVWNAVGAINASGAKRHSMAQHKTRDELPSGSRWKS